MSEREIESWITIKGNHVPIYKGESKQDAVNRYTAKTNEDKRKSDIERNQKEAEQRNNPSKIRDRMTKLPKGVDERYNKSIISVAEEMHREFPEAKEIRTVMAGKPENMGSTIAEVNGLNMLKIRSDLLSNYDSAQALCLREESTGWLAGNKGFESILEHELAHNLDMQLENLLYDYAPQIIDKDHPVTISNNEFAERYSRALGRKVNVGDVVKDIPASDTDAKFIKLGGKSYSIGDFYDPKSPSKISNLIVPLAIQNVLSNWKSLGFKVQPTESQLVEQLSGYVYKEHFKYGKSANFVAEMFAEAYSDYQSNKTKANPISQEIMRLTYELYDSVVANKKNSVNEFYDKLWEGLSL